MIRAAKSMPHLRSRLDIFPLFGLTLRREAKKLPAERREILFGAPAGISPDGDKLRLPGNDRKKNPPPKGEGFFLVLQRGFPLAGINFDSPGATEKKNLPPKGERFFLVLQRGFPLTGINFDSPRATEKRIPRRKARDLFGAPAGIRTPDTLLKRQVLCLLSYWGISV